MHLHAFMHLGTRRALEPSLRPVTAFRSPLDPPPPTLPFPTSLRSNVAGFPNNTIVLYFREPVILKRVILTELLQARAVAEIFLLGWPAVPILELGVNASLSYSSVNQSTDVFRNLTRRPINGCASQVEVNVKPPRADDPQRLPPPFGPYNQTHLPSFFASRAVGGVGIVLRSPIGSQRAGQISNVHFVGRVLYPRDPAEYGPYLSPRRPY
jgi:hypothetical protein